MFQSINPIYIILLGAAVRLAVDALGRRGLEPSAPAKFGLGVIQLGAGFLVLVAGADARRASANDPGHLHLPDLPAAHHRRAVPVAGRPVAR